MHLRKKLLCYLHELLKTRVQGTVADPSRPKWQNCLEKKKNIKNFIFEKLYVELEASMTYINDDFWSKNFLLLNLEKKIFCHKRTLVRIRIQWIRSRFSAWIKTASKYPHLNTIGRMLQIFSFHSGSRFVGFLFRPKRSLFAESFFNIYYIANADMLLWSAGRGWSTTSRSPPSPTTSAARPFRLPSGRRRSSTHFQYSKDMSSILADQ